MTSSSRRGRDRAGFTLMELLVVVAIVVIVSAAAIPVVRPALSQRKVSSAALIVQAELARARDTAIRSNKPMGIRLLPSSLPAFAFGGPTPAYDRMLSIEPAPDYSSGLVSRKVPNGIPDGQPNGAWGDRVGNTLRVTECLFDYIDVGTPGKPAYVQIPNERTNWFWNIRVGDKFVFGKNPHEGHVYTVVGPMVVSGTGNPEGYVNGGSPQSGDPNYFFYDPQWPEYLILVNGQDDPNPFTGFQNGYKDDSFDGIDNNGDGTVDPSPGVSLSLTPSDYNDYELEMENYPDINPQPTPLAPNKFDDDRDGYPDNPSETNYNQEQYTITRRAVPSQGSRTVDLPTGTLIDMTTWNLEGAGDGSGGERSRLPVNPFTGYVEFLIAPNGQILKADATTTQPGPPFNFAYLHFWITDQDDIVEPTGNSSPLLPVNPPPGVTWTGRTLKGERRLVSINTRTGQIVTGSAESFFDASNNYSINQPYFNVEHGIRDEQ